MEAQAGAQAADRAKRVEHTAIAYIYIMKSSEAPPQTDEW